VESNSVIADERGQLLTAQPPRVILSEAKDLRLPVARVHFASTAVPRPGTAVLIARDAVQMTVKLVPLAVTLFPPTVTRVPGAMPRVLLARAVGLAK
jgi:hypothetical protein